MIFGHKEIGVKTLLMVLFLLGFSFGARRVLAAENFSRSSLAVSPAIIEIALAPGEEKKIEIWVANIIDSFLPVGAKAESLIPQADLLGEAGETFHASSWLEASPADFILDPYEQKKIEITVKIPAAAEPGGHYATVYFQPLIAASNLRSQTTYLSARVGVLVFLTVKGEVVEKVALRDFQAPFFSQFGPPSFSFFFQNQGNIHALVSGEVVVKNFWGREVERIDFRPQLVLPKTEKEIITKQGKKFLLGRFSAQADVSYGSANAKLKSEPVVFWVIPWLPLALLTTLLVLCILFRKRLKAALKILLGKKIII